MQKLEHELEGYMFCLLQIVSIQLSVKVVGNKKRNMIRSTFTRSVNRALCRIVTFVNTHSKRSNFWELVCVLQFASVVFILVIFVKQ